MLMKMQILSVESKLDGRLKPRASVGSDCSFSVVVSGVLNIEGRLYENYGILAAGAHGVSVIEGISNERAYTERMAQYLNINKVSPEHFHQVVEELLCRYPEIN